MSLRWLVSHSRFVVAVILVAYGVLGVTYAWVTPLFEAPDENWHFWYVKHLADGQGLAVVTPGVPAPWRQEGSQPPLYYMLAAALIRRIDTSDARTVIINNPHVNAGRADLPGNRNALAPVSRSPLTGAALAAQVVRWLSLVLGAVTVLATYALAREVFPRDPPLAFAAMSLVAFNPQFLFVSGSINNDNLIIALSTLALWLLVYWLRRPPTWSGLIVLAALGGLAALSKLSGLALVGFMAGCISLRALRQRAWRDLILWNGILLAGPLLLAGWFYWRNYSLYNDWLAVEVHLDVSGRRNPRPAPLQLVAELESVQRSFWAVFGWFNVIVADWVDWLFDLLSIASVAGIVVGIRRAWRHERDKLVWVALLLTWFGIVFVSLLRWMSLIKAAQGRLLFPALGAVAILAVWGLAQLAPKLRGWTLSFVVAGLALIAALIPPLTIARAYAPPPLLRTSEMTASYRLNVDFGGQMRLLGYDLALEAKTGDLVPVTLYWQALQPMSNNYSVFVQLIDGEGENANRVAGLDTYPGLGSYPTRQWIVGPVLRDPLYIPITPKVETPGSYGVIVGVYDRNTQRRLVAQRDGKSIGDSVLLGSLLVRPADTMWGIHSKLTVTLGDAVSLVGYEIDTTTARPGDTVLLTLFWRPQRALPTDYTVFVHLGENSPFIAQADSPPLGGLAPSTSWRAGQLIREERSLRISPTASPGVYPLRVGLYEPATGARLPLTLGGTGDAVELAKIMIKD